MIHNNSSDPILIKKIKLQIWLLRDEIENVITNSLTGDPEQVKKTISLLRREYNNELGDAEETPDNVLEMPGASGDAAQEFFENEDEEEETEGAEGEEATEEGEVSADGLPIPEENQEESEEDNEEQPDAPDGEDGEISAEGLPIPEEDGEDAQDTATEAVDGASPAIDTTPFEEGGAPAEVKSFNFADYLPQEENDGEAIHQRRPALAPAQILRAMCFLSEINMGAFYFFCDRNMVAGQSVVIDFLVPQRFLVMAEVVHCRPYNMRSRIISSTPLRYRVAARPLFKKPGERTLLREFLETVEPDVEALAAQQKAKRPVKKKEEEEDLDDLDDLDL